MNRNYIKFILIIILITLVISSVYFLKPEIKGDGDTYFEAMRALSSGVKPANFTPNRILTTFLGLETALLFSKIFGSINGWFIMNLIFYFLSCLIFFNILLKLYKSEKVALLGTIFLASNYAMVKFGLNFLMDMGGWMFYIISLFFTFNFIENKNRKDLLLASAAVGVGGLFKEYAFLGFIPIAIILLYENYHHIFIFVKKSIIPFFIIFGPTIILHIFVYLKFDYTYFDWLGLNQEHYIYRSRIIEYIKSLGSLLNILGIIFAGGLLILYKEWSGGWLDKNIKIFLALVFASILPIFFWPAITQRVLFVVVPFIIIIGGFMIKKYEKYWYVFLPVLGLYVVASFLMDSFLLNLINLPF